MLSRDVRTLGLYLLCNRDEGTLSATLHQLLYSQVCSLTESRVTFDGSFLL